MQGLKPLVKNCYFASKLNLEPNELHILFLEIYQGHMSFSLQYHRILGIVPQTLPVSEEFSEIQCTDFQPKEQFAAQPPPWQPVCMVVPPQA